MGDYGSILMSGIDLPTQNHQNKRKFSLKWKMLNSVIFPLCFSDFLCILKSMVHFMSFRLSLPILFLLTSYGPYTTPICLHLHISWYKWKIFFFEHPSVEGKGCPQARGAVPCFSKNHPLWWCSMIMALQFVSSVKTFLWC